jgi:hypothetical protein
MIHRSRERQVDSGRAEPNKKPVDEEVQQEFLDAQKMGSPGGLAKRLNEHNSQTPKLSGGDLDAAWDRSSEGEESVGGSHATPDQSVVEDLGVAVGLHYDDNEPLGTTEKLQERDKNRWDLNPASSEDYKERSDSKRK